MIQNFTQACIFVYVCFCCSPSAATPDYKFEYGEVVTISTYNHFEVEGQDLECDISPGCQRMCHTDVDAAKVSDGCPYIP
jgi:hypothetical protein